MNIKFNEESTKRIVEGYYKKHEDFDCSLKIECQNKVNPSFGRFIVPTTTPYLSFMLDGKLDVNGIEETVSTSVTQDEVRNAFKVALEEDGYSVDELTFDYGEDKDGLKFRGVVVKMATKKKVKVKVNGD